MVSLLVIASVVFLVVPRLACGLRRLDGPDHPDADMCCIACTRHELDGTLRLGETDIIESVKKMCHFFFLLLTCYHFIIHILFRKSFSKGVSGHKF